MSQPVPAEPITTPILPFRQAEALTLGARHRTGLVRGTRAMITALHKRGLIVQITAEAGTITPAGRALVTGSRDAR